MCLFIQRNRNDSLKKIILQLGKVEILVLFVFMYGYFKYHKRNENGFIAVNRSLQTKYRGNTSQKAP